MAGQQPSSFRRSLKRMAHQAADSRVLGRPTRIAVGVYHLPEISDAEGVVQANQKLIIEQQRVLNEQLNQLIAALSEVKATQLEMQRDSENVVNAVPEGLRQIARRVAAIESQTKSL